jgi:hypothetical protein
VAAAAADKYSSSYSHSHHHGNLLSPRRRSTSKSRSPASLHPPPAPSHPPSSAHADADGVYDEENDTSPSDAGPWPALFHAAFYAQVWCTYRAGFEPIRDLPSLSSLPPFPGPPHSPSHNSPGTLAEGASTVVSTSPKMRARASRAHTVVGVVGSGDTRRRICRRGAMRVMRAQRRVAVMRATVIRMRVVRLSSSESSIICLPDTDDSP